MMTEEEKQAAAYIKLQDDVRRLIVDTVYKEMMDYGSPLHSHIAAGMLHTQNFKDAVKNVIKDQMNKY
jgi:hypothetical protein